MRNRFCQWLSLCLFLALFSPAQLLACATCFGASDDPMAKGMNAGIFSLLAVVVVMLGLLAAFFVFLAKRSVHTPMPKSNSNPHSMVNS